MNVDSLANATSSMKIDSNGEERRKKTETLKTDDSSRKKMIIAYLEGDSAAAAGKLYGIRPRMAQLIISMWQKSQNAMVVPKKGARKTSSPIELSNESRKALVDELDRNPDISVEELQDFFEHLCGLIITKAELNRILLQYKIILLCPKYEPNDAEIESHIDMFKAAGLNYSRCVFIGDTRWKIVRKSKWFSKKNEAEYYVNLNFAMSLDGPLEAQLKYPEIPSKDETEEEMIERFRVQFVRKVLSNLENDNVQHVVMYNDMMTPGVQKQIEKSRLKFVLMGRNCGELCPFESLWDELKVRMKRHPLSRDDPLSGRLKSACDTFTTEQLNELIEDSELFFETNGSD